MDRVLEIIYNSVLKFLEAESAEEMYKLIVKEGMRLVQANYGSILLETEGKLKRCYASNLLLYQIKPRSKGYMFNVYKSKQPIILTKKSIIKIHPLLQSLNIQSDVIVPISNRNKTVGILSLMSTKKGYFTKKTVDDLKLFGQIATLAIRNIQLYDETKKALEARDLFISMAAHELRTPLTTISGYTQLLHTKLSNSNSTQSRWVKELLWETNRLTSLVNEFLEVERIKTGKFNYIFQANSLKDIMGKAIVNFHFIYHNRQLKYNDLLQEEHTVISDFNKLIQVFGNLLANAAKFSSDKTKISLTLDQTADYFVITIKDQGVGIPRKEIKKVFGKFHRATNHSKEGIGLGLFIAKNIIDQHHGMITLDSKEGIGTTVQVKLPKIEHD